jgi:hypothetical protein
MNENLVPWLRSGTGSTPSYDRLTSRGEVEAVDFSPVVVAMGAA